MDNIFCPNCGMKNDNGDVFCGNCGTRLEVRIDEPKPVMAAAAPMQVPANSGMNNSSMVNANVPDHSGPQTYNTASVSNNAGNPAKDPEAGKGHATASLVLGIIAVICWFFGYSSIISVICGFIGLILAGKAKEEDCESGTRTAGFILSLIGLIGGGVILIACVACVGSLGMLGASL